jgi:hypothetical protein
MLSLGSRQASCRIWFSVIQHPPVFGGAEWEKSSWAYKKGHNDFSRHGGAALAQKSILNI